MDVFELLYNPSEDTINDAEPTVKEGFIESAENAARIVSDSINKGQISDVSYQLRKYLSKSPGRDKAVFESPSTSPWIALFFIGLLCSLAFLLFLPIAAGTILYSADYKQYGMYIIITVVIIILFNVLLCRKSILEIRFLKRYNHYQKILEYRSIEIIEDLAGMINVHNDVVVHDLKKAVKEKLIPQGHFGKDNLFFMVTDEVFAKYSVSKAAYDRYFKKVLADRSRMRERTKETELLLAQGEEYLGKIHDSNEKIKDKEVSDKLTRMEKVVSAIMHEVDINPGQANKLGLFINYYLPTTEKLLESYIEIDEKQVKGKSLLKTQGDITKALDSINIAFENLLERFYEEQELDVASDISAMEMIMKQKGLQHR